MSTATGTTPTLSRLEKVRRIFDHFDTDADGVLSRPELAFLVAAVNPSVDFTPDQISSIINEVFRSYSDFLLRGSPSSPAAGLSLPGLLQTYDNGAGDLDLDFDSLFLLPNTQNRNPNPNPNPSPDFTRVGPAWVSSPNHGIRFESTWKVVEEVEILIKARFRSPKPVKLPRDTVFFDGFSDNGWSNDTDLRGGKTKEGFARDEGFIRELREIGDAIDRLPAPEEVFDVRMAMGRTLHDRRFYAEAAYCFRKAVRLRPMDLCPQFRLGNALMGLDRPADAKECYLMALKLAESDMVRWSELLPQVHVNLGIVMEGEGLLINASEHYHDAISICPTHYRALKLLGSSLFGIGEYGPAEKALEAAVLIKPDFADAHCDLGSVLHAVGEEERAMLAFQKAIDLKADHLDALYNLGGLFKDMGRYGRASEMYGRVLAIRPNHWRAQLNRTVALLGAGDVEEANKALREAFKLTNRMELYDAIQHLKHLQGKKKKEDVGFYDWVAVDAAKFKSADKKTTGTQQLADALWIRELQKVTKLGRCSVGLLKKERERERERLDVPTANERWLVKKSELEIVLRKLLHYLTPETFQGAVKAIDEKIWAVLDATGSGKFDLSMFFAIIAPICGGSPEKRKLAAFDALSRQPAKDGVRDQIARADASAYWRYLRVVYFPVQGFTDLMEINGREEQDAGVLFPEFVARFDDGECGLGVMGALVKLERGDRARQSRHSCGVCRYRIAGLMFKETACRFYLCPSCYSECKVPSAFQKEEYKFKECPVE
ncbi:putative TPR repeat-containing protein-like [Iris pallida]|uniref:TPR repeat-containing protein-like n=1 Tax=Iris pallida TaxID=29817 RepID=A0AAX6HAI8_IRIPA|nr:putative TPR repeat-containing protein-like [Iris pallida]